MSCTPLQPLQLLESTFLATQRRQCRVPTPRFDVTDIYSVAFPGSRGVKPLSKTLSLIYPPVSFRSATSQQSPLPQHFDADDRERSVVRCVLGTLDTLGPYAMLCRVQCLRLYIRFDARLRMNVSARDGATHHGSSLPREFIKLLKASLHDHSSRDCGGPRD